MKRLLLCIIFLFVVGTITYAQTETWLHFGIQYGFSFESGSALVYDEELWRAGDPEDFDIHSTSFGIEFSSYGFRNERTLGRFFYASFQFLFLDQATSSEGDRITDIEFDEMYDLLTQVGIIIGPAFRCPANHWLSFYSGIGVNLLSTFGSYFSYSETSYSVTSLNVGLGVDVGLRLDYFSNTFLHLGETFSYDFMNYTYTSVGSTKNSHWSVGEYAMLSVRPYCGLGITLSGEARRRRNHGGSTDDSETDASPKERR